MNDLANLNGKGRVLTVDGRDYRILPLDFDAMGELQTWLDSQYPDPLRYVQDRMDGFTVPQQQYLMRVAIETAAKGRVLLGSPEADGKLNSANGSREILFLALKRGDPTFTREQAATLFDRLGAGDLASVHLAADVLRSDEPDPKAPAPAGASPAPDPDPDPSASPSTSGASTTP